MASKSAATGANNNINEDGDKTNTTLMAHNPVHGMHTPSVAGSVIEAADGLSGGTLMIRIQNITATANLGIRLDLKKIALKCRNTEFNPRRYVGCRLNLRKISLGYYRVCDLFVFLSYPYRFLLYPSCVSQIWSRHHETARATSHSLDFCIG
jgi:hypothetical protein